MCTVGLILNSLGANCRIKLISKKFITTLQIIVFAELLFNTTVHCFHTICGVAMHTVNSLEITFILQMASSDIKISPAGAYGKRLGYLFL